MKKLLTLGLAGILAAGISSCSNDGIADLGGAAPLESDQSFFVNIEVNSTGTMTRATVADGNYTYDPSKDPGFNTGTPTENNINTIYFIFYDEDGNRVATTQVRKDNATEETGRNDSENSPLYSGVVQIDVKHGSSKPAYVMAFINPITSQNFDINPDFATLEQVENTTRGEIIDANNNFAMSKSVYYGTNPRTGQKQERIMATPLVGNQLFGSKEEAEAALSEGKAKVVDIYVERYAAKVDFSIEAEPSEIKINDETLKFVPEYWAVNAYESNVYITKSFYKSIDLETHVGTDIMTWDEMNNVLGGWHWNSDEFHRCYWAQSPAYYAERYPRVADDISDNGKDYYALGYYSYNEIKDKTKNPGLLATRGRDLNNAKDKDMPIYVRENTVSGAALRAAAKDPFASPKAAIGSIVLVGHYNLGSREITENDFIYVMGNATNGYTLFKNNDEMLDYFVRTTVPFAKNPAGTEMFFDYATGKFYENDVKYKEYFKIEHPRESVREALVIDSRFVTIQLKESVIDANDPLYALIDGKYVKVTRDNLVKINQQMLYAAGTVQGFQGGKAYFTIPIKHLGFYRTDNKNKGKNANDKNFDWTAVQSGDFGLVRNHIYTVIVDEIKGLGNGIPDPDDPIVPPTDPEEYFVGGRVVVLNWAVVPAQRVQL